MLNKLVQVAATGVSDFRREINEVADKLVGKNNELSHVYSRVGELEGELAEKAVLLCSQQEELTAATEKLYILKERLAQSEAITTADKLLLKKSKKLVVDITDELEAFSQESSAVVRDIFKNLEAARGESAMDQAESPPLYEEVVKKATRTPSAPSFEEARGSRQDVQVTVNFAGIAGISGLGAPKPAAAPVPAPRKLLPTVNDKAKSALALAQQQAAAAQAQLALLQAQEEAQKALDAQAMEMEVGSEIDQCQAELIAKRTAAINKLKTVYKRFEDNEVAAFVVQREASRAQLELTLKTLPLDNATKMDMLAKLARFPNYHKARFEFWENHGGRARWQQAYEPVLKKLMEEAKPFIDVTADSYALTPKYVPESLAQFPFGDGAGVYSLGKPEAAILPPNSPKSEEVKTVKNNTSALVDTPDNFALYRNGRSQVYFSPTNRNIYVKPLYEYEFLPSFYKGKNNDIGVWSFGKHDYQKTTCPPGGILKEQDMSSVTLTTDLEGNRGAKGDYWWCADQGRRSFYPADYPDGFERGTPLWVYFDKDRNDKTKHRVTTQQPTGFDFYEKRLYWADDKTYSFVPPNHPTTEQ